MSSRSIINIHSNSTRDTFIDIDVDITCTDYSTVYEVLQKLVETMKDRKEYVDPGKYQIRISGNIINKML